MTRIAAVNDDTVFLGLLRDMLALEGWEMYSVPEGSEVYGELKHDQPDLVLLDIRMDHPETGWTVLTQLKLDRATSHIPVIITAGVLQELYEHEQWLKEHDIGILPKPFDIDDLHTCVRTALRSGQPGCAGLNADIQSYDSVQDGRH